MIDLTSSLAYFALQGGSNEYFSDGTPDSCAITSKLELSASIIDFEEFESQTLNSTRSTSSQSILVHKTALAVKQVCLVFSLKPLTKGWCWPQNREKQSYLLPESAQSSNSPPLPSTTFDWSAIVDLSLSAKLIEKFWFLVDCNSRGS
jgi:hypothetical protein